MYIVVGSYSSPYPFQKDLSIILIVIHMTHVSFFPERYSSPTISPRLVTYFSFSFFGYQDSNTVRIPFFV